jgi:hypothetical protein
MRFRRALVGVLVTLMALLGSAVVAQPAHAAPTPQKCLRNGMDNGREVYTDNSNNGGGAMAVVTLCWRSVGGGWYDTLTEFTVWDIEADGSGATIRLEWTGTDGATHYRVPRSRAWTYQSQVTAEIFQLSVKNLYVRACLTNADSPAHHCGPRV